MLSIDLNADLGEGMSTDASIIPLISAANIACGGHTGDEESMKKTVDLALKQGLSIGAHPSYPDKKNFGRKDLLDTDLSPGSLKEIILEQITALHQICLLAGTKLHHVKPHGALYNRTAWDEAAGLILCEAVFQLDPSILIYGLSQSVLQKAAIARGMRFIHEFFADRTYQDNGQLTPRSESNALITDSGEAGAQVIQAIEKGTVCSVNAREIPVRAETICIHGDGANAFAITAAIHASLISRGIGIQAP